MGPDGKPMTGEGGGVLGPDGKVMIGPDGKPLKNPSWAPPADKIDSNGTSEPKPSSLPNQTHTTPDSNPNRPKPVPKQTRPNPNQTLTSLPKYIPYISVFLK